MDEQMARWLANPTKGLAWDVASSTLSLSRIFLWFADDFGPTTSTAADAVVAALADAELAARIGAARRRAWLPATRYFSYSWQLNRTPTSLPGGAAR